MFGVFNRWFNRGASIPGLSCVQFDSRGWALRAEATTDGPRIWTTPDGDGLGLYRFALPPDLPADCTTANDFATRFAARHDNGGARSVETSIFRAGGCSIVRMINKVPQQPSGLTYLGSLLIPFRDFSFVLKVQCQEKGMTGVREAILLDRRIAAHPEVQDPRTLLNGWNPDAIEHDAEFPDHPVSRARRTLDHVTSSLTIDEAVTKMPGFPLPPVPA